MKRPISEPTATPVIELDADRLWVVCDHLGISQELRSHLPPTHANNASSLRHAIVTLHPEFVDVLHGVEETFLAATVFVNAALGAILAQAPGCVVTPPVDVPRPPPALVQSPVSKKMKEESTKKAKTLAERTALINRCSSHRDVLGTRDYGRSYMSRFTIIGTAMRASDAMDEIANYNTIYHCTSLWGMEDLLDMLHDEDFLAFGICDEAKKSEECVRYKVITNEPFLK